MPNLKTCVVVSKCPINGGDKYELVRLGLVCTLYVIYKSLLPPPHDKNRFRLGILYMAKRLVTAI